MRLAQKRKIGDSFINIIRANDIPIHRRYAHTIGLPLFTVTAQGQACCEPSLLQKRGVLYRSEVFRETVETS